MKLSFLKKSALAGSAIVALSLFASSAAYADGGGGLYFEPGVTYELGSSSIGWPSPLSSSTGTINGLGVNAKLGVNFADIFFAGADARYSKPQFKDSSTNYDAAAEAYNYGLIAGVQTPLLGIRAWAGYILGGQLDPSASGNLDVKFTGANGYRVGGGIRFLIVSVNLEYQSLKYNTSTLEAVGPFATNSDFSSAKLTNNSWILSATFPLDL